MHSAHSSGSHFLRMYIHSSLSRLLTKAICILMYAPVIYILYSIILKNIHVFLSTGSEDFDQLQRSFLGSIANISLLDNDTGPKHPSQFGQVG